MTFEENLALRNQIVIMKALRFALPKRSFAQGDLSRQIAETETYLSTKAKRDGLTFETRFAKCLYERPKQDGVILDNRTSSQASADETVTKTVYATPGR